MLQVLVSSDSLAAAVQAARDNMRGTVIGGGAVTVSSVLVICKWMAGRILTQFDALVEKVQDISEDVSFIKGKLE